jgi:hypothetical protein
LQGTSFVGQVVHLDMWQLDVWRKLGEAYDDILRLRQLVVKQEDFANLTGEQFLSLQDELRRIFSQLNSLRAELKTTAKKME